MRKSEAITRAAALVRLVHMGRGQYALQYPWRGHDGPVTQSAGQYSYQNAMQRRAAMIAQYALEMLMPDCDSDYAIDRATHGGFHYGRAREILDRALRHA